MRGLPLFVVAYLGVWTVVGLAAYAFYRPHGTFAAGALTIAAGVLPVALAIVGLGLVIVGSPSLVPGLEPTM